MAENKVIDFEDSPAPDQVFKLLADAVQGHLHIEPAVDEAKVRAIAGEEIEKHQSFAPLAVEVRGEIKVS